MDNPILNEDLKENVKDSGVWKRVFFMLLFGILYSVAEVVLVAVVVFQFLSVLFTRNKNDRLLDLGGDISTYIYQVLRYLTYNSEERPYPFSAWPADKEEIKVPERAAPEKIAPKKAAPKKAAPKKAAPKRAAPKKTAPKKAVEKPESKES